MAENIPLFVLRVLDAMWRRRYLFLLPFLLSIPLCFGYVMFGPRPYVSKALLLLQERESSRENPLFRDLPNYVNMQERIGGLQALLKSDRVMTAVMQDIAGDDLPTTAKGVALLKKRIADSITMDLAGNDFLQIQMKDTSPAGLGTKLEAVVTRFIEALLPEQELASAMQVLVEKRKEELDSLEVVYGRIRNATAARMETLKRESPFLAEQRAELTRATAARNELNAAIATLRKQVEADTKSSDKSAQAADRATELKAAEARSAAMERQFHTLNATVGKQTEQSQELRQLEQQLKSIEAEALKARTAYLAASKRFQSPSSSGGSATLLNAPQRIKLLDPPQDPVFPATPAFKILLAIIAATMLAAIGLVVAAELLDTRLRTEQQFGRLTGLPVIARLPSRGTALSGAPAE